MAEKSWRATIRVGRQYRVVDVAAGALRDALEKLVAAYPADAVGADLVEVRLQADPDARVYTPE